jgi:hypothetical protein
MSEPSLAYKLADQIHSSFFGPTSNLTPEELRDSGVNAEVSGPYQTLRLIAFGEREDRPMRQTLSKSHRNGVFFLATIFTETGGEFFMTRITEEAPIETVPILAETVFMEALQKIAAARKED